MTVLVLADVANGLLGEVTAKALTAALAMGGPVHVLVAGAGVAGRTLEGAARQAAALEGVDTVLVAGRCRLRAHAGRAGGGAAGGAGAGLPGDRRALDGGCRRT